MNFGALCNFSALLVSHGRDYAREGHKDYARDIVRFIGNARILPILKAHGCGFSSSLGKLESDLAALRSECHPEAVATFATELQTIRQQLEQIQKALTPVNQKPASAYAFKTQDAAPSREAAGVASLSMSHNSDMANRSYL